MGSNNIRGGAKIKTTFDLDPVEIINPLGFPYSDSEGDEGQAKEKEEIKIDKKETMEHRTLSSNTNESGSSKIKRLKLQLESYKEKLHAMQQENEMLDKKATKAFKYSDGVLANHKKWKNMA